MGDAHIWSHDKPVCLRDWEQQREEEEKLRKRREEEAEGDVLLETEIEPGRFSSIRSR